MIILIPDSSIIIYILFVRFVGEADKDNPPKRFCSEETLLKVALNSFT